MVLLDENRCKVMRQQLRLVQQAMHAFFAGNGRALEVILYEEVAGNGQGGLKDMSFQDGAFLQGDGHSHREQEQQEDVNGEKPPPAIINPFGNFVNYLVGAKLQKNTK
jgi:hypothetical protein